MTETSQAGMFALGTPSHAYLEFDAHEGAGPRLVTAIASLREPRTTDNTSVRAISILFGIVAIAAGLFALGVMMLSQGWWKLLHLVLAVVFIAAGVVSFIHPGETHSRLSQL